MSHSVTIVFLETCEDVEGQLAEVLAPFDEDIEVTPYERKCFGSYSLYCLGPDCDECNGTGVVMCTYNPESRWDWWMLGGRWDGKIPGNVCTVEELVEREELLIPFAFLTAEGEWIERGKMGWWGIVENEKDQNDWEAQSRRIYEKHAGMYAVVVDVHI